MLKNDSQVGAQNKTSKLIYLLNVGVVNFLNNILVTNDPTPAPVKKIILLLESSKLENS